jgi:hypothetical protein
MLGTCLKRWCLLAFFSSISLTAIASDVLPSHLAGTWGTGASLWDGKDKQFEAYLLADGYGMIAGSTAPARRTDGVDDGKPGPRVIMGFPFRAKLEGLVLTAQLFNPSSEKGKSKGSQTLSCRFDMTGPSLECMTPDGTKNIMKKRSESVPVEVLQTIDNLGVRSY